MFSPQIDDDKIIAQLETLKKSVPQLLRDLKPRESGRLIHAGTNVLDLARKEEVAILLTEGHLSYRERGTTLFFYEAGDLIGMQALFGVADNRDLVVDGEMAVKAALYHLPDHSSHSELWLKLLAVESGMLSLVLRGTIREEADFEPQVRQFAPGEVIIEQGSIGTEVFTLVEGHAEVLVNGVCVGEVLNDEIFGALATITKGGRTATVRATAPSMVMMVPADKFTQLIETRPNLVFKLLSDLARTVQDLNQRLIAKTGS